MNDWITLATDHGPMRAFVARPPQAASRAIVVLQEAFGVNAHIRQLAAGLARQGWLAIAPDLFHRSEVAELPYERHADAVALIGAIGAQQVAADVGAAVRHLVQEEGLAPARIALVGFCFGGRAAFSAATRIAGLGATVVFYGPGIAAGPHAVLQEAPQLTAPLLLHVGADDPLIPPAQVDAIDQGLRAAGARFTQHVYPGAGHAFACDDRPAMYRPQAAQLAWERTHAFLDDAIPPGAAA
jgi:carboxymethylenebutenolidase